MKIDAAVLTTEIADAGKDATLCETQGFDGFLSFEGPHDPFIPLVLAARETSRIQLITAVAIAFARNPMLCAYLANDLQLVSKGRFILGLGSQIRAHIERRFGQPWSQPNRRMREFVRAMRAIWRAWNDGERLDFGGEFYSHTLMSPIFNPGPNPFGTPPILLAGFGPNMVRVAGEVADGWIVHPLHSRDFILEKSLPALRQGLAKAGRPRADFEISCQTIVMLGSNDEEVQRARDQARAQIAFYSSTPAYSVVLEYHGWEALHAQLHRLSKEGKWLDMIGLVTDDMLDLIGVSGKPSEVGEQIRSRNDFADRTSLVLYSETEPDAVTDVITAIKR